MNNKIMQIMRSPTPKLLSPLTEIELTEALVYSATALDEVIDTLFLVQNDPKFFTLERAGDLKALQSVAQVLSKIATLQLANINGGDGI